MMSDVKKTVHISRPLFPKNNYGCLICIKHYLPSFINENIEWNILLLLYIRYLHVQQRAAFTAWCHGPQPVPASVLHSGTEASLTTPQTPPPPLQRFPSCEQCRRSSAALFHYTLFFVHVLGRYPRYEARLCLLVSAHTHRTVILITFQMGSGVAFDIELYKFTYQATNFTLFQANLISRSLYISSLLFRCLVECVYINI